MMIRPRVGILILILALVTACNRGTGQPDPMISESDYTELLVDLIVTQFIIRLEEKEAQRDSIMDELFDRYGITSDQFDKIHEYYQRDVRRQLERVDEIRDRLNQERIALQDARQEHLNRIRDAEERDRSVTSPGNPAPLDEP